MTKSDELIALGNKFGAHNYHPLPVVLSKGEGVRVWDVEGKEYLDFLACYSALNFGHQNPALVQALKTQLDKLAVCSRAFQSEELCLFVKELADFCGLETVLTMNTGVEAVETAIKIARKWGVKKKGVNPARANIVCFDNNFHGRTVTVISFSTEAAYRDGFGPYTPGFKLVPFGDLAAVDNAIDDDTVGVLAEPIQAEAGILLPPPGFLSGLKRLCEQKNVLLMIDEIQTGFGRAGKNFCFEYEKAIPDLLILGKSLGGGLLPLSAVVSRREIMEVIGPGQHGSTFGGNPLACAVGRAVLKLIQSEKLSTRAESIGKKVRQILSAASLPKVKEIRGRGALVGIELDVSSGGARKYCERLAEVGVLCKETHDYVIRIAPPLVISDEDLSRGLEKIGAVIRELA
jgi:ornithine--oxo-acid transaminase